MVVFIGISVFLFGIVIGSFLNVCIYRIPLGQSVLFGRSHCTKCNKKIKNYDLIPILSYLLLRGKCRFCNEKISIRYPIIELVNGVFYLIAFIRFGFNAEMIFYSVLSSILLVIAVIDFEYEIIPNRLVITALLVGIIYNIFFGNLLSSLIGFFAVSSLLYLIAMLSKGGIGGGDVKMMAAFGFCLGWQKIILSLFVGSLIGSVIAVYLMVIKHYDKKTKIPFGPFLAAGIYISIIFGTSMVQSYFNIFSI